MNRRIPLLQIDQPQLISSGLMPDKHDLQQPLWTRGDNAKFYQGKVRRLVPASQMFAAGASKSRGLHQQQTSDGVRWVWYANSAGQIYQWYGPAAALIGTVATQVDQTSQAQATQFDFQAWGNWTLINSGYSGAATQIYKPGTGMAALAGAPVGGIRVMKKKNQLFIIGHGLNGKMVSFSDADVIEGAAADGAWDFASAKTLADQFTIEELDTAIRAAEPLGDYIAAYAEDQMALIYWVGGKAPYGQRVQLNGIGAVGKMAVCVDGRLNYGVSRNGAWMTDGNEFRYIDEGYLNDYLQENVNWAQSSKIVVFKNDVTRCIEFHFPMLANLENSEAWAFDPNTKGWAPVPAFQSSMERVLFSKPLGSSNGTVSLLDSNTGGVADLNLKTKPMLIPDPRAGGPSQHVGAKVDEFQFMCKAAQNVQFRYGVSENIDDTPHYTAWRTLSANMTTYKVEKGIPSGTYHRIEFKNISTPWDLNLQGFSLYGVIEGQTREVL